MSTIDSRRLGATTAVLAMIRLENIAEQQDDEDTVEAFLRNRATAIQAVTHVAGPMSPFLSGFIEAIAEVLYFHATTGTPDLLTWKPDAAKTDDELANARQELEAFYTKCAQEREGAAQ